MTNGRSMHDRVRHYAYVDTEILFQDLQISKNGYCEEQIENSRKHYGNNQFTSRSKDTTAFRLRRAFINPFTIILLILAVISFVTDVLLASNFSRNITMVVIILCMLLISGVIRFLQEMRSKRVADHLTHLLHSSVSVLRNGSWTEIPSSDLVVGDIVRFSAGDWIPADIRLTTTSNLFISQSVITGESAILEKDSKVLSADTLQSYGEYRNIAFMGSAVTGGSGKGIVLAVGQDTVYGGFSGIETSLKNRFNQGANSIAWVLIHFMMVLVPIVFIACGLTKGNWGFAFLFALSVAVGLTPEMLPMVINACLAKGSASMGQKQTIVKNIDAMQGFGSMDVLCVDKTGTLTGDTIHLEYYMDILGNESENVLKLGFLNSLYHTGISNHLDTAILKFREMPSRRKDFKKYAAQHPKLDEVPFDYNRKFSSVLVKEEGSSLLIIKGSVDEVCRRCHYIEYKGTLIPITGKDLSSVHAIVDEMLEDGMKVLAVAYKPLKKDYLGAEDEHGLTLLGYLTFFDAPKETAADAVQKLQELHVKIKVLTGDHQDVAVSVCRRLGINSKQILTGRQMEEMTIDEQMLCIEKTTVFAELSPKQKVQIVQILQTNGHTVGFLGDGMNDLPAIVESDVGISVDTAAEAVKESADVILLKKDLNVLEEGILEGRKAFLNMSKYIRITASSNFGNILSIVIASVFLPFFPMTSVQILLLNLLYDTLCLVLPWDYIDDDACSWPLEWSGRTLGRFMKAFGPISSIFDILTFIFLFFILCPGICGDSFSALLETNSSRSDFISLFQTGWFLESMWTQVLILHLLRTKKIPFFQSRPSIPVMTVTTLGILFFTVLTFTPIGNLIGLTALPPVYFIFLITIVIFYLLLMTLAKKFYIRKYHELF